jgi:hypothetical protein
MPSHFALRQIALFVCASLGAAVWSHTAAAADLPEPAVMLRAGTWSGDVGTYTVPPALARQKTSRWPAQGWQRLSIQPDRIVITPVLAPPQKPPAFLADIAAQVSAAAVGELTPAPEDNTLYLRSPRTRLRQGEVPLYLFKNGSSRLAPELGRRYALSLGGVPFEFTVHNGVSGRNGASYGEGANYSIRHGGQTYRYLLPGFGWESAITAIGDFDADGRPDFLIVVAGSNSSHEYLLLSSLARPGLNPASASLHSTGC